MLSSHSTKKQRGYILETINSIVSIYSTNILRTCIGFLVSTVSSYSKKKKKKKKKIHN